MRGQALRMSFFASLTNCLADDENFGFAAAQT
jgi:hypothetical protein